MPTLTPSLYKTKACNKFDTEQGCPYTHRCQFAHGVDELTYWRSRYLVAIQQLLQRPTRHPNMSTSTRSPPSNVLRHPRRPRPRSTTEITVQNSQENDDGDVEALFDAIVVKDASSSSFVGHSHDDRVIDTLDDDQPTSRSPPPPSWTVDDDDIVVVQDGGGGDRGALQDYDLVQWLIHGPRFPPLAVALCGSTADGSDRRAPPHPRVFVVGSE